MDNSSKVKILEIELTIDGDDEKDTVTFSDCVVIKQNGAGGTSDYNKLTNHPKIGGVEVIGDKTLEDYGYKPSRALSNIELANLLKIDDEQKYDNYPIKDNKTYSKDEIDEKIDELKTQIKNNTTRSLTTSELSSVLTF